MTNLVDLYQPIAEPLDQVRRIFDDELSSEWPFVRDLCEHIGNYRGKMLRPALVLLCADATGKVTREHAVLAAVVEMVHMATLVHDDVLDESDLRRCVPTINRLHGNEAAVLLGDLLISHAFHLCSSLDSQYASRLIGSTTNTVCEGELMQLHHRGDLDLSIEDYYAIISRKTASLTGTCCVLGSCYAGASPAQIARMENYGLNVGMAFQIVDDVLDIVGTEREMGKTLGRDLDKVKLTLPVIHFLNHAPAAQREHAAAILRDGHEDHAKELRSLLTGTESIEFAMNTARHYVRSAVNNLAHLPATSAKRSLQQAAEFIVQRRQ